MAAPSWPPTVGDLKDDLGIAADDVRDDDRLGSMLGAAVAFARRVRGRTLDLSDEPDSAGLLPIPDADFTVGVLRLAGRWHARRRSPDALVQFGELGNARVPSVDPDIERLMRIGRFAPPVVA
jgi:hypothetical protein